MRNASRAWILALLTVCTGVAHPSPGETASQPRTSIHSALAGLTSMDVSEQLGSGCWVRFYDDENFRGRSITLVGPAAFRQLQLAGKRWQDWDSVIVGPQALVVTFDERDLRDRSAAFGPGQRIADIRSTRLGWSEEVNSARVRCVT